MRGHDHRRREDAGAQPDDGPYDYSNRVVAFLELRWGRLRSWEDYEDTERIAAWDRRRELGVT